jgi:hypothetical protein
LKGDYKLYALDRIIDIIKIIHGTSLGSRNTSNQAAASLGVEDLEILLWNWK